MSMSRLVAKPAEHLPELDVRSTGPGGSRSAGNHVPPSASEWEALAQRNARRKTQASRSSSPSSASSSGPSGTSVTLQRRDSVRATIESDDGIPMFSDDFDDVIAAAMIDAIGESLDAEELSKEDEDADARAPLAGWHGRGAPAMQRPRAGQGPSAGGAGASGEDEPPGYLWGDDAERPERPELSGSEQLGPGEPVTALHSAWDLVPASSPSSGSTAAVVRVHRVDAATRDADRPGQARQAQSDTVGAMMWALGAMVVCIVAAVIVVLVFRGELGQSDEEAPPASEERGRAAERQGRAGAASQAVAELRA